MKKTILALTASLLLACAAATTASAQVYYDNSGIIYANGDIDGDGIPNRDDRFDDRYDIHGNVVRFETGTYLPLDYAGTINIDYRLYGLSPPPVGYHWMRLGNNAYLMSTDDGLIADAVYNLFH